MRSPSRGQVYTCDDIHHPGENRPVMVLAIKWANGGNSILVAPFGSKNLAQKLKYPWNIHFQIGECGLWKEECPLLLNSMFAIELNVLHLSSGPIGTATPEKMELVDRGLKILFGFEEHASP